MLAEGFEPRTSQLEADRTSSVRLGWVRSAIRPQKQILLGEIFPSSLGTVAASERAAKTTRHKITLALILVTNRSLTFSDSFIRFKCTLEFKLGGILVD